MIGQYQINGVTQDRSTSCRRTKKTRRDAVVAKAVAQLRPGSFFVETQPEEGAVSCRSRVASTTASGPPSGFRSPMPTACTASIDLEDVPPKYAPRLAELVKNQGLEKRNLAKYVVEHQRLPDIDWFMLAAFTAIAGAGGLSNSMFSNYTREKGWGMGAHVGAIPSAIGGRTITLSHVGSVFLIDRDSLRRWHGWLRHIFRDQVFVWMLASFVGMALPCMVSLEFIRNATVASDRVAAMTAEGISQRYPEHRQLLWTMTLLCGFLVLAPGQISVGDQISRRWTDIIWMSNPRAQRLAGNQVKYVYYSILSHLRGVGIYDLVFLSRAIDRQVRGRDRQYRLGAFQFAGPVCQPHADAQTPAAALAVASGRRLLRGLSSLGISGVVLYDLLR